MSIYNILSSYLSKLNKDIYSALDKYIKNYKKRLFLLNFSSIFFILFFLAVGLIIYFYINKLILIYFVIISFFILVFYLLFLFRSFLPKMKINILQKSLECVFNYKTSFEKDSFTYPFLKAINFYNLENKKVKSEDFIKIIYKKHSINIGNVNIFQDDKKMYDNLFIYSKISSKYNAFIYSKKLTDIKDIFNINLDKMKDVSVKSKNDDFYIYLSSLKDSRLINKNLFTYLKDLEDFYKCQVVLYIDKDYVCFSLKDYQLDLNLKNLDVNKIVEKLVKELIPLTSIIDFLVFDTF